MLLIDSIKALWYPAPASPLVVAARAAVPAPVPHPEAAAAGEPQAIAALVPLIERDEGDVLHAYPDPGTGGAPWTAGYGHTGPDVTPGLVITQEQANAWLVSDLHSFETKVAIMAEFINGEPQEAEDRQFSAMVSLAYNVGIGNLHISSVLRYHNEGNYAAAADAFLLWDKAAGRVLPGLVRRRHQEREMYLGLAIDA